MKKVQKTHYPNKKNSLKKKKAAGGQCQHTEASKSEKKAAGGQCQHTEASNKRQKRSNKRQKVSNKSQNKVKKNKKGQRHKNRNFVYHGHHGQCGYEKTFFGSTSISLSMNKN